MRHHRPLLDPSAPLELLITAPAARLNLVKRVRWARRMKERFGTDYLHLGGAGRYAGLEGIALFYRDIGEKLGLLDEMEPLSPQKRREAAGPDETARRTLADYRCALVCRGHRPLASPQAVQPGAAQPHLSDPDPEMRREMALTPELEAQLMDRIQDAAGLYAGGSLILLNPGEAELREVFAVVDAVVGTGTLPWKGWAPLIPAMSETVSLSFESYVRNVFPPL